MKNKKRSKWLICGILCLVLITISGVYGVFAAGAQEETGKEEKITVEYWSWRTEMEPQGQHLIWIKYGFELDHPNIDINLVWVGQNLIQKLRPRFAAGDPPDAFNTSHFREMVDEELLYPLDELMNMKAYDQDGSFKDSFNPLALKDGFINGKYYCAPRDVSVTGFFYNKKMFKDLGLTSPKTWSEFLNVCKVLRSNGIAPLSQDGTISGYNDWYLIFLAARLAGKDKLLATAMNEPGTSWKDPEFLQAAKMIKELRDKNCFIEGFEGSAYPGSQIDWAQGKTAMIYCGSWLPSELVNVMPKDFEYAMFPFPMVEGGKGSYCIPLWSYSYVVPKDAKHPKEAMEYIRYACSKKVATEQVSRLNLSSAVKGVPSPIAEIIAMADKIVPFRMELNTRAAEWNNNILDPLDDRLIWGKITPEEFIEQLEKNSKNYYKSKK